MTRPTLRPVAPGHKTSRTPPAGDGREHRAPWRDPRRMTPVERLAELGALLAAGHARQREILRNGLASVAQPERACEGEAVDSLENRSKHA